MVSLELAALRKRARAARTAPGVVARAERAKAEFGIGSRQTGLRPPPLPRLVLTDGVRRWVVAVARPSLAWSVSEDLCLLGFRAYCPIGRRFIQHRVRKSNTRKRIIYQFPVFGRYIFIGEVDDPLSKSIHDGLVGIVGDGSGPLALDPEIVKDINEKELAGEWDSTKSRGKSSPHHEDYVKTLERYMKEHFAV